MQFRRNPDLSDSPPGSGERRLGDVSSRAAFATVLTLLSRLSLLALPLTAGSVRADTLHYDAFLSGLPIGSAVVEIEFSAHAYRISGTAASLGVAHLFSDWRSDFVAAGHFLDGTPVLTAYAYDEREKTRQKVLWLADGTVRQVRNNRVRPAHPVRTGTDVLTAFFMQAACWTDRQLHTGRYSYRISGRPSSEPGGCHFEVTDSDGDRNRFHVRFGEHRGRLIPIEVRTRGLLRGRIRLRPDSEVPADLLLAEGP